MRETGVEVSGWANNSLVGRELRLRPNFRRRNGAPVRPVLLQPGDSVAGGTPNLYGAEGHFRPTELRGAVLGWRADGMMVVWFFSVCLVEA